MTTNTRDIHVFGIESSCDDTGVSVIDGKGRILSNRIHSQLKASLNHGGIIPMVAKDYHLENIDRVAREAFDESKLKSFKNDIDAIAVTTRPGLKQSLMVGLNYARQLAKKYSKPLIPIHHMQAHALMPLLDNRAIRFPFLAILISGGHSLIAICKQFDEFHLLGHSVDNAPGDLLDKVARRSRLKDLGPPFDSMSGGASIEMLAKRKDANPYKYFQDITSIPMLGHTNCDTSFAGYFGVYESLVPQIDALWHSGDRDSVLTEMGHISASLQHSILIQLCKKVQRAIYYYRMFWRHQNPDAFAGSRNTPVNFTVRPEDDNEYLDVVISGGCAANQYFVDGLRRMCQEEIDESIRVCSPMKHLCGDNGLMIAWNGLFHHAHHLNGRLKTDTGITTASGGPTKSNTIVVTDQKEMDMTQVEPDSPIGLDIRQHLSSLTIELPKFKSPDLKLSDKPNSRQSQKHQEGLH